MDLMRRSYDTFYNGAMNVFMGAREELESKVGTRTYDLFHNAAVSATYIGIVMIGGGVKVEGDHVLSTLSERKTESGRLGTKVGTSLVPAAVLAGKVLSNLL